MVRFSSAASWLLVSSLTLLAGPGWALEEASEEQGSASTTTTPNESGEDSIGAWSWPDAIAKSVGHEPLTEWKEYRFKDPFGENNGKDGVRGPKANADQVNWYVGGSASLRGKWWPSVTCPYGGAMQVEYYGREQCIGVGQGICKDGWQFGINHYGDNTYLMLWREDDPAFPVFRSFPGATQLCIGEQYPNVAYLRVTYEDCLYYLIGPGAGDANNLARLKIVPDTQKYKPNDVIVKFRDGPGDSNTLWQIFANGASMTNRYALWYNPTNVDTFSELKKRIAAADDAMNPDTIVLCPNSPIVFEDIIDFSDKYFKVECLGGPGCVFDLDGYSFVTNDIDGADFDVEFQGITFENGSSSKGRDEALYSTVWGGAILLHGTTPHGVKPGKSTLTLTSCTFRNNTATRNGGAIGNAGATIIATDTTFTNNEGENGFGGAMYSRDGFASFVGCDFIGNTAKNGGASFISHVAPIFDRCKFIGNRSGSYGGAILSAVETTVKSTLFQCNSARFRGGAVLHYFNGKLSMDDVEVRANTASVGGGGIYLGPFGTITSDFKKCRFYQNTANVGGAIYFDDPSQSSLTGTVFQTNTAITADDIYNLNPSTVQCGGGDNCFCDADPNPLLPGSITTNVLPITCAGDGVGPDCPGCTPPAALIACPVDNGSLGGIVSRAGDDSPPDMDIDIEQMLGSLMEDLTDMNIEEMLVEQMEMIEKKYSGQNRRH